MNQTTKHKNIFDVCREETDQSLLKCPLNLKCPLYLKGALRKKKKKKKGVTRKMEILHVVKQSEPSGQHPGWLLAFDSGVSEMEHGSLSWNP